MLVSEHKCVGLRSNTFWAGETRLAFESFVPTDRTGSEPVFTNPLWLSKQTHLISIPLGQRPEIILNFSLLQQTDDAISHSGHQLAQRLCFCSREDFSSPLKSIHDSPTGQDNSLILKMMKTQPNSMFHLNKNLFCWKMKHQEYGVACSFMPNVVLCWTPEGIY